MGNADLTPVHLGETLTQIIMQEHGDYHHHRRHPHHGQSAKGEGNRISDNHECDDLSEHARRHIMRVVSAR